jgi:hypothetical protein
MDSDRARKYEADKITLLGLFVVGLLAAYFLTAHRYSGPRRAGREVINQIKKTGISGFFDKWDHQSFFLMKDAVDRTIGFTTDVFKSAPPPEVVRIQSAAVLYGRRGYQRKQLVIFQSDDRFNQFSWKSQTLSPRVTSTTEIRVEDNGILTITSPERNLKQTYKAPPDSIPYPLFDLVFGQMIESGYKKIIVDSVDSDGQIIEAVLSRTTTADPELDDADVQYVLSVMFLDGRGFSQQVYLDAKKQVLSILLQQDRVYLFERTSAEDLLRQIPDAADYIGLKPTISQPNQPLR